MLIKYFSVFVFFTLISRLLGLARDVAIAYKLGTTEIADIFFIAFRFPNLFRSFFAEGAFSASFVPIYHEIYVKNGPKRAHYFATTLFFLLLISVLLICVVFYILIPYLIIFFAPGITNIEEVELLVSLTRIMFPYLLFISLVSLIGGIFQVKRKFSYIAICPILLNISFILAAFYSSNNSIQVVYNLAFSVLIAGVFQLLWMLSMAYYSGIKFKLQKITLNRNLKRFLKRSCQSVLSSSIYQLNIFIDTLFASSIPGAVAYLYYADRIQQLPLAIIGIALQLITLPLLSEKFLKNKIKELIELQNRSLEIGIVLCIPAALGLAILSEPLITLLYAHSAKFNNISVINTVSALKMFTLGLPAFILNKIFLSTFLAKKEMRSPTYFALLCLIVNFVGNFILVESYGHVGIVVATIFSAWLNTILLVTTLYLSNLFRVTIFSCIKLLFYILIALLIMSILLIKVTNLFIPLMETFTTLTNVSWILLVISCSGGIYLATFLLLSRGKYILTNFDE